MNTNSIFAFGRKAEHETTPINKIGDLTDDAIFLVFLDEVGPLNRIGNVASTNMSVLRTFSFASIEGLKEWVRKNPSEKIIVKKILSAKVSVDVTIN